MTDHADGGLLDLAAAIAARDAALTTVTDHADTRWLHAAAWAIRWCALTAPTFTTDDVWSLLYDVAYPNPHEPRAMGAAMQSAAAAGICTATDRTRRSHRPACHTRPVRVWQSHLYPEVTDQ